MHYHVKVEADPLLYEICCSTCVHRCVFQLLIVTFANHFAICRSVEGGPDFTTALCQNLISLIPTIMLFSSAASLHWLLRMIAHFSQPPLVQFAFQECLRLLLCLAQQLKERSNIKTQVLQTR